MRLQLFLNIFFSFSLLSVIQAKEGSSSHFDKNQVEKIFKRSDADLSGDIFLLPEYGNFLLDDSDIAKPSEFQTSHVTESTSVGRKTRIIPAHPITTHGFAWRYDTSIPIVFYDPNGKWIKRGIRQEEAFQQDIAPTLADILKIPAPSRASGSRLTNILRGESSKPTAVLVYVVDQLGMVTLKRHPKAMPYLTKLMREGAYFPNASIGQIDAETSVGHAGVATGAFSKAHGISANNFYHPGFLSSIRVFSIDVSEKYKSAGFPGLYLAPTLGDTLVLSSQGRSVNLALGAAARAAVALSGHGNLFKGGKKTPLAYLDDETGKFITDASIYTLPDAAKDEKLSTFAESLAQKSPDKKSWREHELFKDSKPDYEVVRSSPALIEMETAILVKALDEFKIGSDNHPDLVSVNLKSTDYCGHMFGFESDECEEVLSAADNEIKTVSEKIAKLTNGNYVMVVTADHGVAPLPELSGAARLSRQDLIAAINKAFPSSTAGQEAVLALTSSQVYLNKPVLKLIGKTAEDVAQFLRSYEVSFNKNANILADEWKKKGKSASQKFFKYVSVRKN